jgi:hypothetical protein
LALFVAADKTGGCEQFNRMGISPDGNTIAFSLNDKGGFRVDETSALYTLDLTTCALRRMSADKPLATWADINAQGDILFTWRSAETFDCTEVAIASTNGQVGDLTRNRISDSVPQWLDADQVLLATTPPLNATGGQDGTYEVFLSVADLKSAKRIEEVEMRQVVHDVYAPQPEKQAYWSTLPVWGGNLLAYAVLDTKEPEGGKAMSLGQGSVPDEFRGYVHVYVVPLAGGKPRELAAFTGGFEAADGKDPNTAGYVDLALSADGKKLAACFLPADFQKDEEVSHLYVIDLAAAKAEVVKEDVNMYYPRFAPKAEGEPYRLLYLSGTGEEGAARSINILNLQTKEARKLISLPGAIMTAYTDWRWLSELAGADKDMPRNRLRVYHLSDLGVIIAEVNDDGSGLSIRYLDAPRLRLAQVEADLAWAQAAAKDVTDRVSGLEAAQAQAKKLAPGPVEFVRAEAVPQAAAKEGK